MKSLHQDRGGVLCLAAITCEALLRLQATALSGFGLFFGVSFRWGNNALLELCASVVVAVCPSAHAICPLALVRTGSPCVTCPQDFLLSFINYMRYKGPNSFAHSYTVFCTPHRHREGW